MNFRGQEGYPNPRDLNLTICGDGRNLSSGYSFIFAGWDNQKTALLRHREIVAENTDPQFQIHGVQEEEHPHHTHWFYLRAQKKGGHLRFYVDNLLALEYEDPDPLPGGRIAFWTWGNGLLLTRVRVAYEGRGKAGPLLVPPPGRWMGQEIAPPPPPPKPVLSADFEAGFEGWSDRQKPDGTVIGLDATTARQGRQSLKITNATSGGDFAVWTGATEFDLREHPLLSFDYKVSPEVKVNLYFKILWKWYGVVFTGGEEHEGNVHLLGQIPDVRTDNEWHHAEFDLLAALQRAEEKPVFLAREMVFASPLQPYLRCGLGGNPYGASYHLDRFALRPRPQPQ